MRKIVVIITLLSPILLSCSFQKNYVPDQLYLGYISSRPEIKPLSSMDSSFIRFIDYKIQKSKGINSYEVLEFGVVLVDYYMRDYYFEEKRNIYNALEKPMPNKKHYLSKLSNVDLLILIDDRKTKRKVNKSFHKKRLLAFNHIQTFILNDSINQLVSSNIYDFDRICNKMIRKE